MLAFIYVNVFELLEESFHLQFAQDGLAVNRLFV